ncbi:MAG: DNA-binding transcriptional regulator [Phycisphaeraceae bacterium]
MMQTYQAFGRDIMHGIIRYARRRNQWETLFENRPRPEPSTLKRVHNLDGIIAESRDPRLRDAVRQAGVPAVLIGGKERVDDFGWVIANNEAVGRLAYEHLASLGFEQFAFCGTGQGWASSVRGQAFQEAAARDPRGVKMHLAPPGSSQHPDWEAESDELTQWVQNVPKPVAVFAAHDERARQVALACQHVGVMVPEELAVLGVNNDELTCELAVPSLSSIDHGAERLGYEAAALLERLLAGEPAPETPVQVEPVGVIPRQSTNILAIDDEAVARAMRFIREYATEGIDVRDVLRHVPVSRRWLEQAFQRQLRRSLHQEIVRTRVARAKTLLLHTDLSMVEVADRAGFGYASHFSSAFKREVGETPRQFRTRRSAGA